MKAIKIKCVLWVIFLFSLFCSCGSQNTPQDKWEISKESNNSWEVADTTYLNSDIHMTCYFAQNDSFIYISSDSEEYFIHRLSLDDESDNKTVESVTLLKFPQTDTHTRPGLLKICPDGTNTDIFWGLWKLISTDGADESYALVKHDLNGNSTLTANLSDPEIANTVSTISSAAVLDDFCYLLTDDQLIIISQDGSVCKTEELGTKKIIQFFIMKGKLYLAETASDDKTVLHMLSYNGLSADEIVIPLSGIMLYEGENGKLYISDSTALFDCDSEYMTADNILEWGVTGIRYDGLRAIISVDSDNVTVLYYDSGYTIRTLKQTDTSDERITITVMANQYGFNIVNFASSFNETNSQYKVKIIDPGYSLYDEDVLQTKIQLMLLSDDCPDIIELTSIPNWKDYAENDAFEDLTEYLSSGSMVNTNDYMSNILELGKASGQQVFIPYQFSLEMLYGQERYIGADLDWSFEDMLNLNNQYKDIPLFNMYSDNALNCLMKMGMDNFVNYTDRTCSFEQELFYQVLRISATSEYLPAEDDLSNGFYNEIVDGRALLGDADITIPEFYLMYKINVPLPSENTTLLTLKGIPSDSGHIGAWLHANANTNFAIASNSDNKEGAWQFIEFVLSCDPEKIYFPAKTDKLLSRLQDIKISRIGGNDYEIREWTEEDTENLYSIIENAYADNTDDVICQIVSEEAQYYFNGVKTEQETANIIQNRVQLYLAE